MEQRILAVIPAFNEEASVGRVVAELRAYFPAIDVLVVDDGSSDATAQAAESAGASLLRLAYNQGIAGARRAGYEYGLRYGYDILLQLDADGQHDPAQVSRVLAPVIGGNTDMSIGSRFAAGPDRDGTTFPRRLGIKVLTAIISALTGKRILDPTSGFRAANRRVIELFARQYPYEFPEPEEIVILIREGLRVSETPVAMRRRSAGRSFATPAAAAYYMMEVTLATISAFCRRRGSERGDHA